MTEDGPELIFDLVCNHLSYRDVLALRSTSKGLRQFIDGKPFTRLHLYVQKFWQHRRMFYTNEPIGYPYSLHATSLNILNTYRFREQFADVQKMTILHKEAITQYGEKITTEFGLNYVNCFRSLTHLEIDGVSHIRGKLKLPELRIAAFRMNKPNGMESSFVLDCPKLVALRVNWLKLVLTSDTNQLDYLHYEDYNLPCSKAAPPDFLRNISSNLQKLSTICLETIDRLLQVLSDLKKGRLSLLSLNEIRLDQCDNLVRIAELADSLEELQSDPLTKHIEFTFNGKSIGSPGELRWMLNLIRTHPESDERNRLDFKCLKVRFFQFLDAHAELNFLLSVVRNLRLEEDIELTEETIRKLSSVRWLELCGNCKPNLSTFDLFARNFKLLRAWTLFSQTLPERLLEMISEHLVNLELVLIFRCKYETLKPLAKLPNLSSISMDFTPPKDDLICLFENSKTLEGLNIVGQKYIELFWSIWGSCKLYKIRISKQEPIEFDSLNAMIDYYFENGLYLYKKENSEISTRLNSPIN